MVSGVAAQWTFTVLFAVLAAHSASLARASRPHTVAVTNHVLHIVMSLVMVAMAWPWWDRLPWLAQLLFFALATAWFLVLAARRATPSPSRSAAATWHLLAHALMMGAMVWMVAVMAPDGSLAADPGAASHAHHALSAMGALSGVVVTAGLLGAGALFTADAFAQVRRWPDLWRGHSSELSSGAAMSFGMGAMCALMLL